LLGNRDELLSLDCWQRCFYCEYAILAERWFDAFRVCSFGQHEFSVVLPVYRLAFSFLLMFGMNLKEIKQKKLLYKLRFLIVLIGLQVQYYNIHELNF
jgi:hypothetical protein